MVSSTRSGLAQSFFRRAIRTCLRCSLRVPVRDNLEEAGGSELKRRRTLIRQWLLSRTFLTVLLRKELSRIALLLSDVPLKFDVPLEPCGAHLDLVVFTGPCGVQSLLVSVPTPLVLFQPPLVLFRRRLCCSNHHLCCPSPLVLLKLLLDQASAYFTRIWCSSRVTGRGLLLSSSSPLLLYSPRLPSWVFSSQTRASSNCLHSRSAQISPLRSFFSTL